VLKALKAEPEVELSLIVGGTHLSKDFGQTVDIIEKDSYYIAGRVISVPDDDTDVSIAQTMGQALSEFAKTLHRLQPNLIVVLGDRYEMHSAALAALPLRIPVAHIHGGEETEGAMDNSLRHSMTKLSHLHFCSTQLAANRIKAMGEDPRSVIVSGAPALDSILSCKVMSRADWAKSLDLPDLPFNLFNYHPVTLTPETTMSDFDIVWQAVQTSDRMCVITLSNADTSGRQLNMRLEAISRNNDNVFMVKSMGALRYYSAMQHADMMIGNSSSGVIEAASFGLPVVNIGDRQKGRETSANLIQVPVGKQSIIAGMAKSAGLEFKKTCASSPNVYGDGQAAPRIVNGITAFLRSGRGVQKQFHLSVGAS
jgi:UDP-hydrolysing UDP-N-acetyl-D-glucosamine 2-epimerase